MKHLSFLRRHANIVFCLLLCLVYQRAESKELFENNSLDTCYVLAIANVDLTTDLQKKYEDMIIETIKRLSIDMFIAIMAIEAIVIAAIALSLLIGTFCK